MRERVEKLVYYGLFSFCKSVRIIRVDGREEGILESIGLPIREGDRSISYIDSV